MILDFTEISQGNIANGKQDTFEMFARDFFLELGFNILEGPDRGADNGRDLIIEEKRKGIVGETNFKWLVSCKHFAHSGNSVTPQNEFNINDRIISNNADGFIGFYSTLPSAGLQVNLKKISETKIFDSKLIEKIIFENDMRNITQRYFPKSLEEYEAKEHKISNVLDEYSPLNCGCCNKDLLEKDIQGLNLICFIENYDENGICHVSDIYWSCKDECDESIRVTYEQNGFNSGAWEDISDLIIPTKFIEWICAILNNIKDGDIIFSDQAFEKLKYFIISISQLALKNTTEEKKDRIRFLRKFPI